ncbi:unnamed protein product [Rhizoctonia solani]|uniref:diacylglycerol O-acyltransferase n=1 Tax=Rhizoctonia solani TaxID=456999 RepID=A0A8H3GM33_9AGAM|nr:unnamed protein product [Rhizoctonia solani]
MSVKSGSSSSHLARIRWAPRHVPRARRLQTAAVCIWALLIPLCLSAFFFCCSLPMLWPFLIPYLIWALAFDESPAKGGRPKQWFRRWRVWKYFAEYYPARIVKETELPADRPYLFGYHPHGIIGMGAFATFATDGTGFSQHFPGISPHLLTLTSNFHVPFYRDILLHLGICSVSKRSCANILKRGAGEAICIVIGGAAESLSAHPGTADLTLKRRLGFVKIALQHGADLVPVFSFGENDIYEQLSNEKGTTVHKLQTKFQSVFGFTLPLFHGRGLLNYNFGLMPYRRPIVCVVGRPIHVTKTADPSRAQVEATQKLYIEELMRDVMSTPTDTHAVLPSTHDNDSNVNNPAIGREAAAAATNEIEQPANFNASSKKSPTELLNSGEDTREISDGNDNNNTPNTTMVDKVTEKIRGQSMADSAPPATEIHQPHSSGHPSHSGSEGDSSDKETSRKRKLSSRSSVATETAARQHLKRPKESDVPEKEEDSEDIATVAPAPTSPKAGQVFGFGAFASNRSPFISTQSSASSTPAPAPEPQNRSASRTPEEVTKNEVTESKLPEKLTDDRSPPTFERPFGGGFAAFASGSPFQSSKPPPSINPTSPPRESLAGPVRRSKSPVGKHQAFGQYSIGVSRFGSHTARKPTQDDTNHISGDGEEKGVPGHTEFDDILKAKGVPGVETDDLMTKIEMQQVQYNTGEEEDFTVFQTRAKLYTQDEQFAYKERGTGLLKLNVRRSDGEGARIVMRAEGVLRLLLNMALYPGLICELGPDPKFVKVAEITPNERKLHAIKVGSAKLAQELYDHLTENTPTKSAASGAQ